MQKLRSLLGLPVLELEGGTQIGEVQEVVLSIERAVFVGLVLGGSSWFGPERGIVFADLHGIGRDAVTVRSADVVKEFAAVLSDSERLAELCDKPVYSETGDCLGRVADIVCDDATGEIRFYELSDGLITDLLSGRWLMPLPVAQVTHADRIIVPEALAGPSAADHESGGVL
jgi:uncharacterized protein YrrD